MDKKSRPEFFASCLFTDCQSIGQMGLGVRSLAEPSTC